MFQIVFIEMLISYIFGADASFQPLHKENTLEPALVSILEDMGSLATDDYCGVGKLAIQLLSILHVDAGDGGVIGEMFMNERLMSPLLTLLLDIPWMGKFLVLLTLFHNNNLIVYFTIGFSQMHSFLSPPLNPLSAIYFSCVFYFRATESSKIFFFPEIRCLSTFVTRIVK